MPAIFDTGVSWMPTIDGGSWAARWRVSVPDVNSPSVGGKII
jgi:hypothetical protein